MKGAAADVVLSLDEVRGLALPALRAGGIGAAQAEAIAATVTAAERDGCPGHGLFRVPGYVAAVRSGRADPVAEPVIEDAAPGLLRVDVRNGFAPLALERGRPALLEKARRQGIAAMTLARSLHFGALWPDVEPLAEAGLLALAMLNSRSFMPAWGGRTPLYGTNPLAFACPRAPGPPMVFDQAASALSRAEIMLAARDGHTVPPGTGLDEDRRPTTDPAAILAGVQLPFGGYKGASIALMVEILAAGLGGGYFGFESLAEHNDDGGPSNAGQIVIAIDPAWVSGRGFIARVETLFARILAEEGARLPGDRRHEMRRRAVREGVVVRRALVDELRGLVGS